MDCEKSRSPEQLPLGSLCQEGPALFEAGSLSANSRGEARNLRLYPGLSLSRLRLWGPDFQPRLLGEGEGWTLLYCAQGRITWQLGEGGSLHLGPGAYSIQPRSLCQKATLSLPLGVWEGCILLLEEGFFASVPEPLGELGWEPQQLRQRFCTQEGCSLYVRDRAGSALLEQLFRGEAGLSPIYEKLKVQELLLDLWQNAQQREASEPRCSREQRDSARQIHRYLMANLAQRITIEELAREFHLNTTTLKESFKAVYGQSIGAHMKEHRMEQAARLLGESSLSVEEISRQVGYESPSKFSAAFRAAFGLSPLEYRKRA